MPEEQNGCNTPLPGYSVSKSQRKYGGEIARDVPILHQNPSGLSHCSGTAGFNLKAVLAFLGLLAQVRDDKNLVP